MGYKRTLAVIQELVPQQYNKLVSTFKIIYVTPAIIVIHRFTKPILSSVW
jgi:hypothetical protein